MRKIFRPAISLMNRLKFPQKMIVAMASDLKLLVSLHYEI